LTSIWDGIIKAFQLILSGDPTVYEVTTRSLLISGTAVLIAALWSIPIALFLGTRNYRGKLFIKGFFTAMIGLPTVGLGLILFLILSKAGPLGFLHLLYTPTAIILGEAILITPLLIILTTRAIEDVDPEIKNLAKTLGATEAQAAIAVLKEASSGVFLAGITSFNRAVAELGVAQLVGGSIAGLTEVLTTGIALETARGNLELSIAWTIILLAVVFGITLATLIVEAYQRRRK
jgi:tungstate transport system permease protein